MTGVEGMPAATVVTLGLRSPEVQDWDERAEPADTPETILRPPEPARRARASAPWRYLPGAQYHRYDADFL